MVSNGEYPQKKMDMMVFLVQSPVHIFYTSSGNGSYPTSIMVSWGVFAMNGAIMKHTASLVSWKHALFCSNTLGMYCIGYLSKDVHMGAQRYGHPFLG